MDISPEFVADARRNAAINRITKAEFRAGPIEELLEVVVRTAQFDEIVAVIGEFLAVLVIFLDLDAVIAEFVAGIC